MSMLAVASSVTRALARVVRNPERLRVFTSNLSHAENFATSSKSKLISAWAGFPKDLLFGVSTVGDARNFGHDSSFVARHHWADVVGVADGVGGWSQYGIDPSKFSQALMTACSKLVESGKFDAQSPAQLLEDSYREILVADEVIGSSTACIVILEGKSSHVYSANLGDSGFIIYRPSESKIVAKSDEQQHAFNTPFQISCVPESRRSGGGFLSDSPAEADIESFEVENGDLILVATDGLFDNVPVDLICNELSRLSHADVSRTEIQEVVNSISLQARRLSIDEGFMSPFAHKAIDHGYPPAEARGGKIDDITVVLSLVVKE